MVLIGADDDPRFTTFAGRIEHRDEVDQLLAEWIGARSQDEVLVAFEQAHAAVAPVLDMEGIAHDPHYAARRAIVEVDGIPMQGLIARLSATPGAIRWAARALGADDEEVRAEIGDVDG
jgi:crotonobetainyl-CoA:carnitine CoA-transferase CaiB-like acyl-CoA transferase